MRIHQQLAIATALLATTGSTIAQHWYQETPQTSPSARRFHGLGFDPGRGLTVLFGGTDERSGAVFGDTWEYDGADWTQRAQTGPAARERFASCVFRAHGMFVVFGGRDAQGQLLGDTWAWDGQSWSPVPTAHTPPPRMDASMAFDEARERIVLFGGRTLDPSAPLADTWEFDGNDWIERSTPTSPDPRFGHVTTFDPLRQRTVLFGGFTNGGGSNAVDTWEFDGSDWREVLTATTPTTSVFPALGFHRGHGVAVLVGATGSFNPAPQTWAFDGHDWQRGPLAPSGFAGRQGHAIGYDEARDAMVLFGGATITLGGAMPRQETWELSERAVFEPFGRGCATSAGPLGLESPNGGRPEIGRALDLEAGPLPPAALPLLLLGLDDASWAGLSLPLELSGFGLPGCDLLVRIDAVEPMVVGGAVATAQLRIPREVGLVGRELFAQALLAGADGATSNAARLILGN